MRATRALVVGSTAMGLLFSAPRPARAQAWVPPAHSGAVTFVVEEIDHVGRMADDGSRQAVGKAVNLGIDVEVDYAFTDRFSISTSLPYIISKYTDPNPPPKPLPFPTVDACSCWGASFADFGFTARYNAVNVNRSFMLTPFVSAGLPSHAYSYVGEAVVGRRLNEFRFGADAGQRLDRLLTGLSLEAGYRYTIVGRIMDIPNNRSNGWAQVALAFPRGFSTRAIMSWQRTHGGLRFPAVLASDVPEMWTEFHRMLRDNYLHAGGGLSYSRGPWEISGSVLVTARGSNSHDIRVFTLTFGRAFEIGGDRSGH